MNPYIYLLQYSLRGITENIFGAKFTFYFRDIADYHLETRRDVDFRDSSGMQLIASGNIVGCYKWSATLGKGSTIVRYTIMRADSPMIE